MVLIFWQNIISPHQLPYIKTLHEIDANLAVVLIAAEHIPDHRTAMGWSQHNIVETKRFKFILSPSDNDIESVFKKYPKSQHFFSNIRSFPMVHKAFKTSIKFEVNRHLIVEGPFLYSYPKFLHYLKTLLLDYRYFKHITKVYAIGHHAISWYSKFNFKSNQIVPFSYVVDGEYSQTKDVLGDNIKLVFVGNLTHRKGVDILLNVLSKIDKGYKLDLIGDGKEYKSLEEIVRNKNLKDKIKFLKTLNNHQLLTIIGNYDVLILPSRHDGWGAVINEGLMAGLFVVCSDQCGASELINEKNGIVFSHRTKNSLFKALTFCLENKELIRSRKVQIKEWSNCIKAKKVSEYFLRTLKTNSPATPPWKKL